MHGINLQFFSTISACVFKRCITEIHEQIEVDNSL